MFSIIDLLISIISQRDLILVFVHLYIKNYTYVYK